MGGASFSRSRKPNLSAGSETHQKLPICSTTMAAVHLLLCHPSIATFSVTSIAYPPWDRFHRSHAPVRTSPASAVQRSLDLTLGSADPIRISSSHHA